MIFKMLSHKNMDISQSYQLLQTVVNNYNRSFNNQTKQIPNDTTRFAFTKQTHYKFLFMYQFNRFDDPEVRKALYGTRRLEPFSNKKFLKRLNFVNSPRKPNNRSERIYHVNDVVLVDYLAVQPRKLVNRKRTRSQRSISKTYIVKWVNVLQTPYLYKLASKGESLNVPF